MPANGQKYSQKPAATQVKDTDYLLGISPTETVPANRNKRYPAALLKSYFGSATPITVAALQTLPAKAVGATYSLTDGNHPGLLVTFNAPDSATGNGQYNGVFGDYDVATDAFVELATETPEGLQNISQQDPAVPESRLLGYFPAITKRDFISIGDNGEELALLPEDLDSYVRMALYGSATQKVLTLPFLPTTVGSSLVLSFELDSTGGQAPTPVLVRQRENLDDSNPRYFNIATIYRGERLWLSTVNYYGGSPAYAAFEVFNRDTIDPATPADPGGTPSPADALTAQQVQQLLEERGFTLANQINLFNPPAQWVGYPFGRVWYVETARTSSGETIDLDAVFPISADNDGKLFGLRNGVQSIGVLLATCTTQIQDAGQQLRLAAGELYVLRVNAALGLYERVLSNTAQGGGQVTQVRIPESGTLPANTTVLPLPAGTQLADIFDGATGAMLSPGEDYLLDVANSRALLTSGTPGPAYFYATCFGGSLQVVPPPASGGGDNLYATVVTHTASATLTAADFGKLHVLSGATALTLTLPDAATVNGKQLAIRVASSSTALHTIAAPQGGLDGRPMVRAWANETREFTVISGGYRKVGGVPLAMRAKLRFPAGSNQTAGNDAVTLLQVSEVLEREGVGLTNGTPYRLYFPRAGRWQVGLLGNITGMPPGSYVEFLARLNGVLDARTVNGITAPAQAGGGGTFAAARVSESRDVNEGDYVELVVYLFGGSGQVDNRFGVEWLLSTLYVSEDNPY